jgi:putative ABC transport system permease protein
MKLAFEAKPLREALAGSKAEVVGLLAAAVAIVLLTTLANLANLWLGRALARQRELALATALGASAARAGASVFAEVLLLSLAAGAVGLLLAPFALAAMRGAGVIEAGSALVVEIDAPMVGFALVVAFGVSLALALPAWWLVRRVSGMDALRQGPTVVSDRPAVARARRALIAVQIAASVALLGSGGLLLRSLQAMIAEDTGFAREGTLLASVEPRVAPERAYGVAPTAAEVEAVRAFHDRVRAHPGIVASFANAAPFSGSEAVATFLPPGKTLGEESAAKSRSVGADYFRALGIPIIAGRDIDPANAAAEIVVDEVFAARYLAPGAPIGQQIGFQDGPEDPLVRATVVGVARTVKHAALAERDEQGTYYVLQERPSDASIELVAHTSLPLADARAIIEREAAAAGLRVSRIATIDALIWRTLRERTALLGLIGGFALFGTALATLGLYAVLAFATRRRTAEYGLKLALGADTPRLAREVLRDALRIVLPGLALGAVAGVLAVRAIAERLYGVGAADPGTWAAVAGTILLLVLLAAALPARRAARTDPMHALRNE